MDSARAALRSLTTDERALANVGCHARLELTFGVRDGRTVLARAYAEPPFRVGRALPDHDGLHLILASSAPGVFGGDCLTQTIIVESGARVRLTSQSAIQVHANRTGASATLTSAYRVERGGHLACEWDPLIPFPDAAIDQRIAIELASGSTLLWSDALMSGREARGERWRFARVSHELRLCRDSRLAYLERYNITPGAGAPNHRWVADKACYFGTMLGVGPAMSRGLTERVHRTFAVGAELRSSADSLEPDLLLARLVADDGVCFHRARAVATQILQHPELT